MFIPMINIIIIKFYYLQIQEYEILKYIPYVDSSCVWKRIVIIIIIIIIIIISIIIIIVGSVFAD